MSKLDSLVQSKSAEELSTPALLSRNSNYSRSLKVGLTYLALLRFLPPPKCQLLDKESSLLHTTKRIASV